MMKISDLIVGGVEENKTLILAESAFLENYQKNALYERNKTETTVPFLVNLFLGYSVGSFIQGDIVGGAIGLGLDVVGGCLFMTGMMTSMMFPFLPLILFDEEATETFGTVLSIGSILYKVGGGLFLVSKIFQLIRPRAYASKFNTELKEALGIYAINFIAIPTLNIASNKPEFTASVAVKL
ncbi:MAG: P13 family porin [Spirochaetales bacterium]